MGMRGIRMKGVSEQEESAIQGLECEKPEMQLSKNGTKPTTRMRTMESYLGNHTKRILN